MQKQRGRIAASTGWRRASSTGPRGPPPCLQPGLGEKEHKSEDLRLDPPFAAAIVLDDDVSFAVRAVVILGLIFGHGAAGRREHEASNGDVGRIRCGAASAPTSDGDGGGALKPAAARGAATLLLRSSYDGPDRTQPSRFVTGFRILEDIDKTHVSKEVQVGGGERPPFFGPAAAESVETISKAPPILEMRPRSMYGNRRGDHEGLRIAIPLVSSKSAISNK